MALTKADSVVINIDNISTNLKDATLDGGLRDYVDDQILALNTSLTSSINGVNSSLTTSLTGKLSASNNLSDLVDVPTARLNLGIGNPLVVSESGLVRFATALETTTGAAVDAAVNVRYLSNGITTLLPDATSSVSGKVMLVDASVTSSTSSTIAATPKFVTDKFNSAIGSSKPFAFCKFKWNTGNLVGASFNVASVTILSTNKWRINYNTPNNVNKLALINGEKINNLGGGNITIINGIVVTNDTNSHIDIEAKTSISYTTSSVSIGADHDDITVVIYL